MQITDLYKIYLANPSIQTDTRKIKQGDIFFALKGDNFNGNHFANAALNTGAAYAIVDEEIDNASTKIIKVDDVLTTLQLLAKHHREQFIDAKIPFIAITGSNGKTTTKELIHQVLSATYKTYTTDGNLNNHIGIPLTLLKIKPDVQIAVIEMGANHKKEIESYCVYAQPTHGLITNCGKAHLEGFGGEDGIKQGKGELFEYLSAHNGTAFIMNDYEYLQEMSKGIQNIITYGTNNAMLCGNVNNSNSFLEVCISGGADIKIIKTNLVGAYNLPNVLAAVAIGKYFKVPDEKIKASLENYAPTNSRSQLIKKDGNTYILDAYNANPSSMKVAIENFVKMNGTNKVVLLGGMMELGKESITEHKNIIDLLNQYNWQNVVLVGGDYSKTTHPYLYFETSAKAGEWLKKQNFINTNFLIKGSRSMQMEKVLS